MNTGNVIRVIDKLSQETMNTFGLDESEKAHAFAMQMEEMGFDVELKSPTIVESFKNALGLNDKQTQEYDESVKEELEDHDGQELDEEEVDSCCFKPFKED